MTPTHPKWIIKFIHNSKISAVKIVEWENHHEVATVPNVYTFNDEDSDGKKAANLIVSAPDMLTVLEAIDSYFKMVDEGKTIRWDDFGAKIYHLKDPIRKAISRAKGQ